MTAVNPVVPAAQCLRMSTEHQQSVLRSNNSVNTPARPRGAGLAARGSVGQRRAGGAILRYLWLSSPG
jgi:hypothetical protein